ncbi:prepilin-type N-terminal cleavage/methylation domain-containing protein [bacterium]|nr:MAG: prepilin-type N-terminal cleavage/methylation domain-containing protein [bacterium]
MLLRKAFTLVELLVVVGLIAILAAILFPVFAQTKEAAKRTECITNVRQLSAAMIMYVTDHDGVYPMRVAGTDTVEADQWIDMIHPYVKAGRDGKTSPLSKCSAFVPAPGLVDGYGRKKITGWGYGMNGHLHAAVEPVRESIVVSSSETALIGDSTLGDFYARPRRRVRTAFANSNVLSPYDLPCDRVRTRHGVGSGTRPENGGSTMSFTDGHVKSLHAGFVMAGLGVHPLAPRPGDRLFFGETSETWCVGGGVLGP